MKLTILKYPIAFFSIIFFINFSFPNKNKNACGLKAATPQYIVSLLPKSDSCIEASTRYIDVYCHVIQRSDGSGNYSSTGDGYPIGDTLHINGVTGNTRITAIFNEIEKQMSNNYKMYLPNPNQMPVLPIRIKYRLKGIFYRANTRLYNTAMYDLTAFDTTYSINRGTAINVFFTKDAHPGGYAYVAYSAQPSLVTTISDWNNFYKKYGNNLINESAHNLIHEFDHLLGLQHDFDTDTPCDDTPNHGNTCYQYGPPNCTWANISNNHMSYAMPYNMGFSPCQISIMLNNLNTFLAPYCAECKLNCTLASTNFYLTDSIICASDITDMQTVHNSSTNYTQYRIQIQGKTGLPTDFSYDSGWVTGQMPDIFKLASFTGANMATTGTYKVIISTNKFPDCIGEVTQTHTFQAVSNAECGKSQVSLATNPNNDELAINLNIKKKGKFSATLTDANNTPLSIVYPESKKRRGKEQKKIPIGNLKPGLYHFVVNYEGKAIVKSFRIVR